MDYLLFLVIFGLAAGSVSAADAPQIRIIYDNTSAGAKFEAHWGFAAVIDHNGKRILFDSGARSGLFMKNLALAGIDAASIDVAVISHEHLDHRNGIYELAKKNHRMRVYFLDAFPDLASTQAKAAEFDPVRVTSPVEVAPGVFTTGVIEGLPPEQALVLDLPGGLVVITGCSHPGVEKMVEAARRQRHKDRVILLTGGFHLVRTPAAEVRKTITALKNLGVERIAPAHCTGPEAIALFERLWGKGFESGGAGKIIHID